MIVGVIVCAMFLYVMVCTSVLLILKETEQFKTNDGAQLIDPSNSIMSVHIIVFLGLFFEPFLILKLGTSRSWIKVRYMSETKGDRDVSNLISR